MGLTAPNVSEGASESARRPSCELQGFVRRVRCARCRGSRRDGRPPDVGCGWTGRLRSGTQDRVGGGRERAADTVATTATSAEEAAGRSGRGAVGGGSKALRKGDRGTTTG